MKQHHFTKNELAGLTVIAAALGAVVALQTTLWFGALVAGISWAGGWCVVGMMKVRRG